jgi:hypothetical protein
MSGYSVEFFKDGRGRYPAQLYIDEQLEDHQAKILAWIQLLQEKGPLLRRPYADLLRDKIYELRPIHSGYQHRILYFFDGKTIVLTHGFLKKADEVDPAEIELARRYREEWNLAKGKAKKESK